MKKFTFLIVLTLVIQITVLSQSCLPEGITFTSQEEIDYFQVNYTNCTEIEGDVQIGTYQGSNITNLDGLSALTSIGGDLRILNNETLANLTGLANIASIGGGFTIIHNSALTNLTGLDNITSILGDLMIDGNYFLASLAGIDNVTSIGGDLWISGNATLASLAEFGNLDFIGEDLRIIRESYIMIRINYLTHFINTRLQVSLMNHAASKV